MDTLKNPTDPAAPSRPVKVRGTATFHTDRSFDFVPQGTGEPVQHSVRTHGRSKLYETQGERRSIIAHLVTSADTPDPVADLYDALCSLTRTMPDPSRRPRPQRRVASPSGTKRRPSGLHLTMVCPNVSARAL